METKSPLSVAALTASAALVLLAGGCGEYHSRNFVTLEGPADFQRVVLQADRPVLVQFDKDSCPTCVIQEASLDQLAEEYRGRVIFAKWKIRQADFKITCQEVWDRYNLFWVPTVLLFVNGQEQKKWELNHPVFEFRQALDAVVVAPPMEMFPAGMGGPAAEMRDVSGRAPGLGAPR